MVEEEKAVQTDLFVYTRFRSRNIYSQETSLQTYTYVFSLDVKMVDILTDLKLEMKMR